MISNEIQNWLQNEGSFIDGLAIYAHIGKPASFNQLKQYISFPFIPDHAYAQLVDDFRAYLFSHPVTTPIPTPDPVVKESSPVLPAEVSALHAEGKKLLKERDAHRAQLVQMVEHQDKFTEKDRYAQAKIIMTVQLEIDEVYQRIEQFKEKGVLPKKGSAYSIQQATIKKMNRINTLRSAISRLNKRLKNPANNSEKQELEAERLAKRIELEDITEELNL